MDDAVLIYFGDATLANAFVAGHSIETAGVVLQRIKPERRVDAGLHRTK
jgi:hypothetical protein